MPLTSKTSLEKQKRLAMRSHRRRASNASPCKLSAHYLRFVAPAPGNMCAQAQPAVGFSGRKRAVHAGTVDLSEPYTRHPRSPQIDIELSNVCTQAEHSCTRGDEADVPWRRYRSRGRRRSGASKTQRLCSQALESARVWAVAWLLHEDRTK